ncbi:hypothetical protein RhiJN_25853 [Ceratobasidium sp. AG-Ba]|nr:hypothetical protein RhiJN_25853 [Ceratobasidium sp. AG-Ba]
MYVSPVTLGRDILQDLTAAQQAQFDQLHTSNTDWLPVNHSNPDEANWVDVDQDSNVGEAADLDDLLHTGTHSGRRRPQRSWEERGCNDSANWALQKARLVTAFLHWRHNGSTPARNETLQSEEPTYTVLVTDIFERSLRSLTSRSDEIYPNETLIHHGCLGSSPIAPTTAFSLYCLRFYRVMRSRCSTYSIEAFVKTLADLHRVPFRSYHVTQFTRAITTYDDIEFQLSANLRVLLGRANPDYRMKHNCPACSYELVGEAPLSPRKMFSMDGNSSLKRPRKGGASDPVVYTPSYFMPSSYVDMFQNEVKRVRPPTPPPEPLDDTQDDDPIIEPEPASIPAGVGPTDSELLTSSCATNWRAAQSQQCKKTSNIFEETGVFLACCRHGLIAVIVDKLSWHPMWLRDLGLEDFEWCERVFSSSNAVARCIHHASQSMRRRFLEWHYFRWDDDRFASSGQFLFRNYLQACSVVRACTTRIESFPLDSQVSDEEVDLLIKAEQDFLTSLKTEPVLDSLRVEYVNQLQTLALAEHNYKQAWGVQPHSLNTLDLSVAASSRIMQQRRSTQHRWIMASTAVERLEVELDIPVRWTPSTPEYVQTLKHSQEQKYRAAVDQLELLVLQRLFELSRLNIGGIGYKLCRHINKALKTWSKAIRTAVSCLNKLASNLTPPLPAIAVKDVLHHQFLAEFNFLRICREDVRRERWAQRQVREVVEARLHIRRAKEERTQVEVEACRLATFMADEQDQLVQLARSLESDGRVLEAQEVCLYGQHCEALNSVNCMWLRNLFAHPGFGGGAVLGVPVDVYPVPSAAKPIRDVM